MEEKYFLMKQYQKGDRPRERIRELGATSLSDCELIAILLRTGSVNKSALGLANQILHKFSGVSQLREATFEELTELNGVGEAKAAQIFAALELGRRMQGTVRNNYKSIRSSSDVARMLVNELQSMLQEHFIVLYLNTKNRVIHHEVVFKGSLNCSVVHPREIFREAVKRSAASIICAHNHPSGDPTPSEEDIAVTERLTTCGNFMGIELLDHVIVGDNCFVSMRDKGYVG